MRQRHIILGVLATLILLLIVYQVTRHTISAKHARLEENIHSAASPELGHTKTASLSYPHLAQDKRSVSASEENVLEVRVLSRAGTRVEGAQVALIPLPTEIDTHQSIEAVAFGETDLTGVCRLFFPREGTFNVLTDASEGIASGRVRCAPYVSLELILSPAAQISGATVTGLGAPVAQAFVSCFAIAKDRRLVPDSGRLFSDEAGRFVFSKLTQGPYMLTAKAQGYASGMLVVPETGGLPVKLILTRGGDMEAIVADSQEGKPVGGVKLRLSSLPLPVLTQEGITDARGYARITSAAPGKYELSSASSDHVLIPDVTEVEILAGKTARVEVSVEAAGRIAGRILDQTTKEGVRPAIVHVNRVGVPKGRICSSNSRGDYEFTGLAAAHYRIGIIERPLRYGPPQGVFPSMEVELKSGEDIVDLDFALSPGRTLEGTVLDDLGVPVPGALVTGRRNASAQSPSASWLGETQSNSRGEFILTQSPLAEVYLRASIKGRCSESLGPLTVSDEGLTGLILKLDSPSASTIAGQVLNDRHEGVRANIQVDFPDERPDNRFPGVTTDADGFFVITEVPAGQIQLNVGPDRGGLIQYIQSYGPFTLGEHHPLSDLRLVLHSGGLAISGVLKDPDGGPVPYYFVELEKLDEHGFENYATAMSDEHGNFSFENVEEAEYQLTGQAKEHGLWRERVQPGGDLAITLPRTPGGQRVPSASGGGNGF